MVRIEVLTKDRFDEFYDVFTLLMKEGYESFSPALIKYFLSHDYSKPTYQFWLDRNFRRFLLAIDDNNKIVAFLIGDNTYGGVGFISWVGVIPQFRGKGIGKMLMVDYEVFCKSKKGHLLELFAHNKVKPFYEKLGFKEIGRRTSGFYGAKNIIMDKAIGDWNDNNLSMSEI